MPAIRIATFPALAWKLIVPLVTICVLVVAVFGEVGPGKLQQVAQNTAHVPAFAAIASMLFKWPQIDSGRLQGLKWLVVGLLALALGILVEVTQYALGRDASLGDIYRDCIGILLVFAIRGALAAGRAGLSLRRSCYWAGAGLLAAIGSAELIWGSIAYVKRTQQFPVLVDFNSSIDGFYLQFVGAHAERTAIPHTLASHPSERGLFVQFDNARYPSIILEEPVHDWSRYQRLSLEVINPGSVEIELTVRVHDRAHDFSYQDRFNRTFRVLAERRMRLDIPLSDLERAPVGRRMDLRHIAQVIVFPAQPVAAGLILQRAWLN